MTRTTFRRLVVFLVVFAALITACSGDDDEQANGENPNVDQLDVGPDVQDESGGTTTIDPGLEDDIDPEVLEATKLSRVFVAANGNDGRSGENSGNAVKSIDRAISLLAPGGTVVYQAGTYPPLRIINKNGASGAPIRIEASGQVEFRDDDYNSGAGILIRDSQHIEVIGMQTRRSLWGIYMENSHHVTLRANNIGDVGQEGIRIKAASSNVRIEGNTVADTGRRTERGAANGEGIYIGTGNPSGVDHVKNVTVINNRIMRTTDEAIDVKRPSSNIDIIGNTISDVVTQTSGAIVVHLNSESGGDPKVNVERNVIRNITRSSPYKDGNCIVSQVTVRIVNNALHNCQHRGIFLKGSAGTATVLHNTLINTGDQGTIVNEGRGMRVISENNLGADGDQNRTAGADVFVDPNGSNYGLKAGSAGQFVSAPNKGVSNDLTGSRRPGSGSVTFGAVEASGVQSPATTMSQAPATTAAQTESAAAPRAAQAKAAAPTTTRPTTQRNAAPATTAASNTRTATVAKPAPQKAVPKTEAVTTRETTRQSASPAASPNPTLPNTALPSSASVERDESNPVRSYPGASQRDPLSSSSVVVGRTLGEPAVAGPLFPGNDDQINPYDDHSSCITSLVCVWAPFL